MPGPALNDRMVVMKYKILLVDDDRALLKMLSNFLELKGYEVNTASGGMIPKVFFSQAFCRLKMSRMLASLTL